MTPEQGFWDEITSDIAWFKDVFRNQYPDTLFDIAEFINTVNREENASNPRERAKNCLNNLYDKIKGKMPNFDRKDLNGLVIENYVKRKFEDSEFVDMVKRKIMPVLHRQ